MSTQLKLTPATPVLLMVAVNMPQKPKPAQGLWVLLSLLSPLPVVPITITHITLTKPPGMS